VRRVTQTDDIRARGGVRRGELGRNVLAAALALGTVLDAVLILTRLAGAALDVPHSDSSVETAGGQYRRVRAPDKRVDSVGVAPEFFEQVGRRDVPQPDPPVLSRRGQNFAVRRKRQRKYSAAMAAEHPNLQEDGTYKLIKKVGPGNPY